MAWSYISPRANVPSHSPIRRWSAKSWRPGAGVRRRATRACAGSTRMSRDRLRRESHGADHTAAPRNGAGQAEARGGRGTAQIARLRPPARPNDPTTAGARLDADRAAAPAALAEALKRG